MSDAKTAFEIIRVVTRTMMESRETQPALDAVVRLISEKMGAEVCSIYLHDAATDRLRMASTHGLNRGALSGIHFKADEGLTGAVFSQGEIVNIANPRSDPRFMFFPGLGEDHLNNFLGVPIPPGTARGSGVLILQGFEPEPFSHTVEDLAYTLAAQLGTLLENRHLKSAPLPMEPASLGRTTQAREAPPFLRAQLALGEIADGTVLVLQTHQIWDNLFFSESTDSEAELKVLREALELARKETRWLRKRAGEIFAEMDARIFDTHEMFLMDQDYVDLIENHVREKMTAAFAVKLATRELSQKFQQSGNPMLANKAADLRDVGLRLVNALGEVKEDYHPEPESDVGVIVASSEHLPSDLVYLQSRKLLGILCETGGLTSHAAILARSLDIPCLMGIPGLTEYLHSGMRVILEGHSGLIHIRPEPPVVREYQRLLEAFQARGPQHLPPDGDRTRDGHPVQLSGNVSLLSDLQLMKRFGIKSVGLYRSEFFFMIRSSFPDEDTQFGIYRQVMERCGTFGVTFRLLDVGGDKPLKYFDWGKEENPALGWRSIRMLLQRPDILKPHLRALLRAAQLGHMRVVIPMIATLNEIREIKEQLRTSAEELEAEHGVKIRMPPVGIMVEIPAVVLQIEGFLFESDFLCLGHQRSDPVPVRHRSRQRARGGLPPALPSRAAAGPEARFRRGEKGGETRDRVRRNGRGPESHGPVAGTGIDLAQHRAGSGLRHPRGAGAAEFEGLRNAGETGAGTFHRGRSPERDRGLLAG